MHIGGMCSTSAGPCSKLVKLFPNSFFSMEAAPSLHCGLSVFAWLAGWASRGFCSLEVVSEIEKYYNGIFVLNPHASAYQ